MRLRSIALVASLGCALTVGGCGKPKPAPGNNLNAMDDQLINGAVTSDNAQLAGTIKVDPTKTQGQERPATTSLGDAAKRQAVGQSALPQGEDVDTAPIPGLSYGKGYASKLPPEFPLMPGAMVQEAAGREAAPVLLRIVSFSAPGDRVAVLDWYAAKAIAAGYSATRNDKDGDAVLEGDRSDGSAYSITAGATVAGRTPVDLVWTKS